MTDETAPGGPVPGLVIPEHRLLVVRGRHTALRVAIPPFGSVTIGRSADNDVVVDESGVAEHHLILHFEPLARVEILDGDTGRLQPRHKGPPVEQPLEVGQRVDAGLLDHFRIGSVELELLEEPPPPRATATAGSGLGPGTVVRDPEIEALLRLAEQLGASSTDVLILGETGTGKDLYAELIHRRSDRSQRPLVRVSGAERFAELLAGGYQAHLGGTVLLDEVGGLSASTQLALAQLLEAPERRELRFLATSNHDLRAEVRDGHFRKDLYFRLNKVSLTVPPLRDRPSEILPLAERIALSAAERAQRPAPQLSEASKRLLLSYAWPGNIRELINVIERALLVARGPVLEPEHFPEELHSESAPTIDTPVARASTPAAASPAGPAGLSLRDEMAQLEKRRILEALDKYPTQVEAAKALDIPIRTFVNRLDALGIPRGKKKE